MGKYSLIDPRILTNSNSLFCQNCPTTAFCPGGYRIELNKGYWRNSTENDIILFCEQFFDFCL